MAGESAVLACYDSTVHSFKRDRDWDAVGLYGRVVPIPERRGRLSLTQKMPGTARSLSKAWETSNGNFGRWTTVPSGEI
jgi:hypothetical protein